MSEASHTAPCDFINTRVKNFPRMRGIFRAGRPQKKKARIVPPPSGARDLATGQAVTDKYLHPGAYAKGWRLTRWVDAGNRARYYGVSPGGSEYGGINTMIAAAAASDHTLAVASVKAGSTSIPGPSIGTTGSAGGASTALAPAGVIFAQRADVPPTPPGYVTRWIPGGRGGGGGYRHVTEADDAMSKLARAARNQVPVARPERKKRRPKRADEEFDFTGNGCIPGTTLPPFTSPDAATVRTSSEDSRKTTGNDPGHQSPLPPKKRKAMQKKPRPTEGTSTEFDLAQGDLLALMSTVGGLPSGSVGLSSHPLLHEKRYPSLFSA